MGTWDTGFFDNDMACEWENGISDKSDLSYIEQALTPVLTNKEETLDIDIANKAVAGAEALARLLFNDGERSSYTTHLDNWASSFSDEIPDNTISMAIRAIDKILDKDSELFQFWTLRGEHESWFRKVNELKKRLKERVKDRDKS